jgi:predicted RNA-binding Zn-ribbon protein involved in translation (DUF1610 family)
VASPWTVVLKWFPRSGHLDQREKSHFRKSKKRLYSSHPASAADVSGLPCPNCGSELAFLAQYQRHYCYACGRYAPEGFGDRGAKRCPTCTGILSFVVQYDRHYCYRCNAYPPEGVFMESSTPTVSGTAQDPTAGSTALVVLEPANLQEQPAPASVGSANPVGQAAEEEIHPEGTDRGKSRRPLDREEITTAKKPLLMALCKDHDLDFAGTREELRQRLLNYLDQLEGMSSSETPVGTSTADEQQRPEETESQTVVSAPTQEAEVPEAAFERPESEVIETREEGPPSSESTVTSAPTVDTYPVEPIRQAFDQPAIAEAPSREPTAIEVPAHPTVKVEHPCPTCGRALTYISQYSRWYCYSCRAYAPRTKAKFACPNCGASLRWIMQYSRWWCDACRRYAPTDLPKPEQAAGQTAPTQTVTARSILGAAVVHRHQSPGSGIGLVTFGLLLFVMYEVLVDLPIVLSVNTGLVVTSDVAFGLRFFAFLFVAIGAILGLSAIRDRR